MKLAEEKLSIVTKEELSFRYNNARQCQQNYLRMVSIIDNISEELIVNLQKGH
jgi:hypothetical protein